MTYLVLEEIREGFNNYPRLKEINNHIEKGLILIITELSEKELTFMANLPKTLSDADRSCIAVAHERRAVIASDDRRLKRETGIFNIHNIETEAIISLAIKNELITCENGNEILEKMKNKADFKTDKIF